MNTGLQLIEKDICSIISSELNKIGILFRLFSRVKDSKSLDEKIQRKKNEGKEYSETGKKIQDIIGVRIVTYFKDDIEIVKAILSNKFYYDSEEIDDLELTVFKPKRTNIICRFNPKQNLTFDEVKKISTNENFKLIDSTFELQLRTILSEGWHEIDHSLRYKCKEDWIGHTESERLLNGIYANLETNDIALKNLFNELAYQHFKNKNWEALIRTKFRLNFQLASLSDALKSIFDENISLAKTIFKSERSKIIIKLCKMDFPFPVNINNLVFVLNFIILNDEQITDITPEPIKSYLQQDFTLNDINLDT